MINFIIYEEGKYYIEVVEKIIHKFMANNDDHYKIYKYKNSNYLLKQINELIGQNVYILDTNIKEKSGLDLAYEIRKICDFSNNQIILLTDHNDLIINAYHRKLLMLDFILKCDNLEENLIECFKEIYQLFNRNSAISIKQDGEIYRIPHSDILYIEKNKNENSICIHTERKDFIYRCNISDIENNLKRDMRFLRSHRSAIVNVERITKVDMINNVIYFKNKTTNYLSRDRKKDLERQLKVNNYL